MVDSTTPPSPLPRDLGRPATAALAREGITTLDDVRQVDLDGLLRLHGVGPKAIRVLREALASTPG